VRASERVVDGLADAILDGTPIDWAAAESSAEEAVRPLVRQLRALAAVATLARGDHGSAPQQSPSEAPPARTDTQEHWGHLRLVEPIGRGAFGEVYRAWDTRLDREVALKLLPAERPDGDRAASAIIQEGRLLARVRHPNVVTIYGAEQISDRVGLWMELVRGQTLEQILEQRKVVGPDEAVAIGLELCRAMSAVHGAGLLHRDIKAQNVMRADDGRILLMDFGTGRELADDASSDLAGTPLYLAPEVLNGQPATVQSDVYSLGVLLFHLVTGAYPVRARTVRGVRRAHARGERTAVRTARAGVPRRLARLIERAIDADPIRRQQSADALGAELAALTSRARTVRRAIASGLAAASILAGFVGWEVAGRPAQRPAIAVLPFTNLGAEPESEYFADALTDELIQILGTVEGLEVRSRTSSFVFRDASRDLPAIGEQLGVNLFLEGSLLRDGDRLGVSAVLVQVSGDVELWEESFEREVQDIFEIRDEISEAVVGELGLKLDPDHQRADTSLEAYDLYIRARGWIERRGVPNARKAAELFERVIALDREFAPAYAGLANAYAFMSFPFRGDPYETAYREMQSAAVRALELDPRLPEAHAAMGWLYAYEHDWTNAAREFEEAIRLNPSLTQSYTSYSVSTLQPLRRFDVALQLLDEAAGHDPLSLDVKREIGEVQLFAGRYTEAVDTFRGITEQEPDFPFVQAFLAKALAFSGGAEEAIKLLDVEAGSPWLAHAYVTAGRRAEAERLAAELKDYPYRLAVASAALGHTRQAIEALEQAAKSEPHRIGRLLIEPELAPLLDHPRVVALRRTFGLP